MRKATFKKSEQGKYTPVNKRAKRLCSNREVAKATLKRIVAKGKASCYVYTNAGLRKVA